jgi:iron complex transport system substrate-binding protein
LKKIILLGLVSVLVFTCCDRLGNKDSKANQTTRIVCVSKQINEFIYAIGAEQDLVAVDLSSIYPEAIKKLPNVGYHRALSAEGILSMKPTLFLHDGSVGPDAVIAQIKQVGIPMLEMKPGKNSIDTAMQLMHTVGVYFNKEVAADSVIKLWKSNLQAALADTLKSVGKKKPRVMIIHYGQAANIYLAVAAPDIILATDYGFDKFGDAEKFATMPGVALTPAGKNKRIYRIDESEIIYFGPRTPSVIQKVRGYLNAAN